MGTHHALVLDLRNVGDIDWVWQFVTLPSRSEPAAAKAFCCRARARVHARTIWASLLTSESSTRGICRRRGAVLLGLKQRAEALTSAPAGETRRAQDTAA